LKIGDLVTDDLTRTPQSDLVAMHDLGTVAEVNALKLAEHLRKALHITTDKVSLQSRGYANKMYLPFVHIAIAWPLPLDDRVVLERGLKNVVDDTFAQYVRRPTLDGSSSAVRVRLYDKSAGDRVRIAIGHGVFVPSDDAQKPIGQCVVAPAGSRIRDQDWSPLRLPDGQSAAFYPGQRSVAFSFDGRAALATVERPLPAIVSRTDLRNVGFFVGSRNKDEPIGFAAFKTAADLAVSEHAVAPDGALEQGKPLQIHVRAQPVFQIKVEPDTRIGRILRERPTVPHLQIVKIRARVPAGPDLISAPVVWLELTERGTLPLSALDVARYAITVFSDATVRVFDLKQLTYVTRAVRLSDGVRFVTAPNGAELGGLQIVTDARERVVEFMPSRDAATWGHLALPGHLQGQPRSLTAQWGTRDGTDISIASLDDVCTVVGTRGWHRWLLRSGLGPREGLLSAQMTNQHDLTHTSGRVKVSRSGATPFDIRMGETADVGVIGVRLTT
jgi:hypothetical protein